MMFSSYIIISCIWGIIINLNLYGNYLLDHFKLEEKYPSVFNEYMFWVLEYLFYM